MIAATADAVATTTADTTTNTDITTTADATATVSVPMLPIKHVSLKENDRGEPEKLEAHWHR